MSKKKNKKVNKLLVYVLVLVAITIIAILFSAKQKPEAVNSIAKEDVAPIITLKNDTVILPVGGKFAVTATATDTEDGDISSDIKASEIDTNTAGTYEVTLEVIDSAGNKAVAKQNVIVRAELTNGLPVLMYHFFYDNVTYYQEDNNWLNINDFEEQLKYLTENEYYYPTWEEVDQYIDGKIKLPEKSVVLTVDDGDASFFDLAVPMLQKYKVPATIFVISEWYGWRYNANMECVIFESHSHSMHESGGNGKGRMVNWSKEKIIEDLKLSSKTLGGADVFCYPFGHYDDTAIEALKETGYKMAFTIVGGRVSVGYNKYTLPRVRVTAGNSLNYFASSVR
ncbi:MAG: polysaccharide deacetylase family protein [Clostridia bacterium]|nr:polysaccharide deacetylase family protein [Clostridia bacterium]